MSRAKRGLEQLRPACRVGPGVCVNFGSRGRGLFATEPVKRGDLVMAVPHAVWFPLSHLAARRSAPAALVDEIDAIDAELGGRGTFAAATLTTLGLIFSRPASSDHHRAAGHDDADDAHVLRQAYLDTLPDDASADENWNPSLWNSTQLDELGASPALTGAEAFRQLCDATCLRLRLTLNTHDFLRFSCLVRSRALSFRGATRVVFDQLDDDGPEKEALEKKKQGGVVFGDVPCEVHAGDDASPDLFFGLVPAFDLLNHNPREPSVTLAGLDREGSISVRASRDVAPGEELTLSYGRLGNAKLLRVYGFALDANADDSITVRCEDLDRYCGEKRPHPTAVAGPSRGPDVLSLDFDDHGVEPHRTEYSASSALFSKLPANALASLRARFYAAADDTPTFHESSSGKVDFRKPISVRNEKAALEALVGVAKTKLESEYYHASIAEDEAFLGEPRRTDDWRHHVARTRLGEKRLWASLVATARDAHARLSLSDKYFSQPPPVTEAA